MSVFSMVVERSRSGRVPQTVLNDVAHASPSPARLLEKHWAYGVMQTGLALCAAAMVAGCGSGYRPVVTPINPSGPASQPTSYAVVVSSPSASSPGVATVIDYSGDTIVAQATIGVGPLTFALDGLGSDGYTINSDGTLTTFPVSSQLQTKNVQFSTLSSNANPIAIFAPSTGVVAADLNGSAADVLTGSPATLKLSVPVNTTPIMTVGLPSSAGQRDYVITQGPVTNGVQCNVNPSSGPAGEADAIETASFTVSAKIALGKCPVYAVQTPDAQRLFVLNRGDDTISVINTQLNAQNSCTPFLSQSGRTVNCHPILPLSTAAVTATGVTPLNGTAGMGAVAGPVYAEYNAATQQLVVSNYDGGSISVIDVSLDEYGNDSATFGTTYTIPVGTTATPNPASVTVLYDGSRAYTANQNDDPSGTGNGTVTVVNLASHTVEKTVAVTGHPRTVVSTQNSQFGKVYVASPDSPYLTILRTDQDIVDATVLVQGNILDVRTSTQNGTSGNANSVSRKPGYGQPCYLPGSTASATLASCATLP